MAAIPKPHRPSYQEPASLEALAERSDPIARLHAAHDTAAALLHLHPADPALTQRLICVTDDVGIATLADLWETRPARSLPGALYRLYLVREWMTHHSEAVALEYRAGLAGATAEDLSAPEQVRRTADEILHGAFTGNFAAALRQAGAVCATVARGRHNLGHASAKAQQLELLSDDLTACAALWDISRLE
ncbi:MAG: hypothetical protein ACRCWS_03045 [Propionibacteriaceae bacterium]